MYLKYRLIPAQPCSPTLFWNTHLCMVPRHGPWLRYWGPVRSHKQFPSLLDCLFTKCSIHLARYSVLGWSVVKAAVFGPQHSCGQGPLRSHLLCRHASPSGCTKSVCSGVLILKQSPTMDRDTCSTCVSRTASFPNYLLTYLLTYLLIYLLSVIISTC